MISDAILDRLQDDVYNVLRNTPSLVDANVLIDNAGDIENAVARALQNLTAANGKRGLAVIVMLPEITTAQRNLPGPPMLAKIEIQVIEQVLLNRDVTSGTLIRSGTAAIRALGALHLQTLGDLMLYGDENPVKPLPVKAGHMSHVVALHCRLDLVKPATRCADISGALSTPALVESSGQTWYSNASGAWPATKPPDNQIFDHAPDLVFFRFPTWVEAQLYTGVGCWIPSGVGATLDGTGAVLSTVLPFADAPWYAGHTLGTAPGTIPTVAAFLWHQETALTYSCATDGAAIWYTSDGSYPSPSNPAAALYAGPIILLAADTGKTFRAAGYAAGTNPGNVLELIVTD